MAAPSYHLTNMVGTTTPADNIITLIETDLTAAGWTFIEDYAFTQASTARGMRVWKNPSTLNAAGADYYIGLVRNTASPFTYLAVRAFEGWNTSTKAITGAAISGSATFGQTWKAIAYGKGTYVAVGSNGAFATSSDGISWTLRTVGASTLNWVGVAYGSLGFLAVNNGGTAYKSTDGITWTQVTLPSQTYYGVAYGAGLYVLPYGTSANTTPDLVNFTTRTSPGIAMNALCFGNGGFMGLSNGGTQAAYSVDGITWGNFTISAGLANPVLTYGNGNYVAASGLANTMYVSSTVSTLGSVVNGALPYTGISALAYLPGLGWVATNAAAGGVLGWTTAASPTTGWTSQSIGGVNITPATLNAGGGQFVMLTNAANGQPSAFTSTDMVNWYARGMPYPASMVPTSWTSPNASLPGMAEATANTLVINTAYDVAVLASKSYLAVAINSNGSGTQQFACVAGLFNPAYADSQATNPPLMTLHLGTGFNSSNSGVSRTLRSTTDYLPYSIAAGPESLPLGQWTQLGVIKEPASQTLRASRVALVGGNTALGMAQAGYRGLLYDAVCVAIPNASTVKLGDSLTVGATTYYALGQSPAGAAFTNATAGACGYFFDIAAGS